MLLYYIMWYMTDEEIRQELIKKRKQKRARNRLIIFAVAIALTVTAGWFAGNAIGNKRYEDELSKFVSVVGDAPLISTAMEQIGNEGGQKFWEWFGFTERVDWCAIFVSWCEDQCGYINDGKAPSFALVSDGSNWFMDRGQWLGPDATPEAGDLIFFDWEQDDSRDHVGIVTGVADGMVFTVEGNSSDRCRQKRYPLDDPLIYGYAQINE